MLLQTMKKLTIAIIIPAYNEASIIDECLQSIAHQTTLPDEVIVVDNNSTDNTAAIAASYPFVTVIREKKQGIGYARDAGFNHATSDIIGRIDADTVLPENWVESVLTVFVQTPAPLFGASGHGMYPSKHFPRSGRAIGTALTRTGYLWTTSQMLRSGALFGSNMAISKELWKAIGSEVCKDDDTFHEDVDLSVHAKLAGATIQSYVLPPVIISRRSLVESLPKKIRRIKIWREPIKRHRRAS